MGILDQFQSGGFFMWAILISGLFALELIVERARALYLKYSSAPKGFETQVREFIKRGGFTAAKDYALIHASRSGIGRITAIGLELRAQAAGEEEIQARMDEALTTELEQLDRRTGFLAMIGNVATLLGLLGTISGMIRSFSAVAMLSAADRAMALSSGISEALHTTAFGLLVAVPSLVAYAVFRNRTDRISAELTEATARIYHDLIFLSDSGAAPKAESR